MSIARLQAIAGSLDNSMSVLSAISRGELRKSSGFITAPGVTAWIEAHGDTYQFFVSEYETGSEWPTHTHPAPEWLFNVGGEFEVRIELPEGETRLKLSFAECIKVPHGIAHSVVCKSAGKLLAMVIPPDHDYD